jgi:hypothetical protein
MSYCREIEAHLCRKNDGYLIRIVGPAFELVSGWEAQGIPLKVACAGVDRYFERYYRKGPRRRPVRIDFCDADVLEAFDDWRRAVGVGLSASSGSQSGDEDADAADGPVRRRSSLAAHIERALARLMALAASTHPAATFAAALDRAARELDLLLPDARRARGTAREAVLERLRALDAALLEAVIREIDPDTRRAAEAEARQALAPFHARMPADAYTQALAAAFAQQVRDRFSIPTLAF